MSGTTSQATSTFRDASMNVENVLRQRFGAQKNGLAMWHGAATSDKQHQKKIGVSFEGNGLAAAPPMLLTSGGGAPRIDIDPSPGVGQEKTQEKDAASALASLFSAAVAARKSSRKEAAAFATKSLVEDDGVAKEDEDRSDVTADDDVGGEEGSEDEEEEHAAEGEGRKMRASTAANSSIPPNPKRKRRGGGSSAKKARGSKSAAKDGTVTRTSVKPHAMVDHTYTDYSIVDEDVLADIDRREKVLSEAGDVVKFIEEAERSVWARGEGGGMQRRLLSEADERERAEKIDKLQKMLNGKLGGPRRNSGGVAQPFPLKLMEVLDLENTDHIISWMPHGRAFIVHSPKLFTSDILPLYFKQTKFMSFTRQLNLWGFKRITRRGNRDAGAYYHELFLRGRPRLCTRMRREKIKGTGIKLSPNPDAEPDFYKMAKERPLLTAAEQAARARLPSPVGSRAAEDAISCLPSLQVPAAEQHLQLQQRVSAEVAARNAIAALQQRNDLNQQLALERVLGRARVMEAREQEQKRIVERVALLRQQQTVAAAARTAAAQQQQRQQQELSTIVAQLVASGGAQGQNAELQKRLLEVAVALNNNPLPAGTPAPSGSLSHEELLLQLQALQRTALRPPLGMPPPAATTPRNADLVATLAAQLSAGGGSAGSGSGGGGGSGPLLPDTVLSQPPGQAAGALAPAPTDSTLLRALLLEQQQQRQAAASLSPSTGAAAASSDLLAAVAAQQRAQRESTNPLAAALATSAANPAPRGGSSSIVPGLQVQQQRHMRAGAAAASPTLSALLSSGAGAHP